MDPKSLRKQYMHCIPRLNKALQFVQSQMADIPPSDFSFEIALKPYASVKRKMLANNVRDPQEIPDLVRGRLFFSDRYKHHEVFDLLKKLFGSKIKSSKKKDTNDCGLSYPGVLDVNLDVDGTNVELRLMPIEYRPHQKLSHEIYDRLRSDTGKLTDNQKALLRKLHNRIFRKLSRSQAQD